MNSLIRMCALICAVVVCQILSTSAICAQETGQPQSSTVVHGRVLNKITNEPIARALVTTNGNEYATMTDDRGQFEIKIGGRQEHTTNAVAPGLVTLVGPSALPFFQARKPGFLESNRRGSMAVQSMVLEKDGTFQTTIYLLPEALIVGHVNVPGSEGDVRIDCELFRRTLQNGRMTWSSADRFTSWTDGEFRFSGLEAGTYKLITHEQMDSESMIPMPGAPLYGYPPIYYPNTTDFSAASPIVVRAGETAQVNFSVARRQYYPVHIPVANPPAMPAINLNVHPMGHRSPGWSLGYNPAGEAIEGMLPDGTYTVEVNTFGEQGSSGIVNFSVRGAPAEATPLRLIPNTPLTVVVHEEFQSEQNVPPAMIMTPKGSRRMPDVQVSLDRLEEFEPFGRFNQARPAEGSDEHTLLLENVGPGRYRFRVSSSRGYASSIQSGGVDLLHQPLVVGLGGGTPPIEITMRDDGGEVSGTVEGTKDSQPNFPPGDPNGLRFAYLLPLGDSFLEFPPMTQFQGDNFTLQQVPPGTYLVLVYPDAPENLPYGDDEAVQGLKNKGQIIQVEVGQKTSVRVKMITEGEGE
jgi:hypothetical protein